MSVAIKFSSILHFLAYRLVQNSFGSFSAVPRENWNQCHVARILRRLCRRYSENSDWMVLTRCRTPDLPIISSDSRPLSYRRLEGASGHMNIFSLTFQWQAHRCDWLNCSRVNWRAVNFAGTSDVTGVKVAELSSWEITKVFLLFQLGSNKLSNVLQ